MSFQNAILLGGGLLVALPILIHLAMRRKPRHLPFPSIRFIQQKHETNTRQLNLRHWMLLALRCLVVLLAAAVLARPSVAAASAGNWILSGLLAIVAVIVGCGAAAAWSRNMHRAWPIGMSALAGILLAVAGWYAFTASRSASPNFGNEEAPVAAAVVVDSAAHMEYRLENRNRIEVAQESAKSLVALLPSDSQVAVVDGRPSPVVFSPDRGSAQQAIDRWRVDGGARPLAERAAAAFAVLQQAPQSRRELYLYTDMSRGTWNTEASKLATIVAAAKDITIYVIDVGVAKPQNFGLGRLRIARETVAAGAPIQIDTSLYELSAPGERVVECVFEIPDPTLPVVRDGKTVYPSTQTRYRETISLVAGETKELQLRISGLEPGTHQGFVRVLGEDALPTDNVRWLTIEVAKPKSVLVVAPANVDAAGFAEAISPSEYRETGQVRFLCKVADAAQLPSLDLESHAAVCLLDPRPLTASDWNRLAEYVATGHGLALYLGPNAEAIGTFADRAATDVLGFRVGGVLRAPVRTPGDTFIAPRTYEHAMLAEFRSVATSAPWDRFPVRMYWGVDQRKPEATVVLSFSDGKPAVLETVHGRGKILTFLTPATEPMEPDDRRPWNELWSGEDAWPWFVLLNESVKYLAAGVEGRLNYAAGEMATLVNNDDEFPDRYQLFLPGDVPQEIAAADGVVQVRFTQNPGLYRMRGLKGQPIGRGFAVNLNDDATELTRIEPAQLDQVFGKGRYQYAASPESLQRVVGEQRVGKEMGPLLAILLTALAALEHLLSNRFYAQKGR